MWHRLVGKIRSLELGTSGVSPGLQKDRFHAAGHAEITISHPTSETFPPILITLNSMLEGRRAISSSEVRFWDPWRWHAYQSSKKY
jgi:hypothetical protein